MPVEIEAGGPRNPDQAFYRCDLEGCTMRKSVPVQNPEPRGWYAIKQATIGGPFGRFCTWEHAQKCARDHNIDAAQIRVVR